MLKRRTFVTNDSAGCQFHVEATYYGKQYNFQAGKYENHKEYRAMGVMAENLEELKRIIGEK